MDKILPYAKALMGFVVPALVVLAYASLGDSDGGEIITRGEWVTALVAALGTGGTVYRVPNKDRKARHQAESVQPPEA